MTDERFKQVSGWLWGAFLAVSLAIGVVVAFGKCSPAVPTPNAKARVDSVLVVRHDTIKIMKDSLRTKIVYIDTSRVDTVEKILDSEVPPIGDENVCIAENQLRQCVKCQDSLETYKKIVSVDSGTIDSLSKIAKSVPDTVKEKPPITQRLKDFGAGLLVGAGIRSFF